jgi:hypothetical protein
LGHLAGGDSPRGSPWNGCGWAAETPSGKHMKLLPGQTDEASLLHLGMEAVSLFEKHDFSSLADCFGYMMAYGQDPAVAIEEIFHWRVARFREFSKPRLWDLEPMTVKYFKPNDLRFFAVVEGSFASDGCPFHVSLMVFSSEDGNHLSLEDFDLAAYDEDE